MEFLMILLPQLVVFLVCLLITILFDLSTRNE